MPYDGRIKPIEPTEGTPVTKGQVVAQIKEEDIEVQKSLAKAAVERLKASSRENDDAGVETTAHSQ